MKKFFFLSVFALLTSAAMFPQKHFITDAGYLKKVEAQFNKQKESAAGRGAVLFSVFNNKLTAEEEEALKFLYAYMPLSDLADYSGSFFLDLVRYSFKARDEFSWGKNIPEDIFRHFVLPYRVNNENLDTARIVFFKELKERLKNLSMKQAALEVNHWCHEKVTYKGTDGRTISPLGAVCSAFGRCGEESTFLVTALRSVGIPARQVYVPRWAHCDDNHAWVEVWVDGKWNYMGACEPEADLNIGWFTEPARRAMLVHTKVFGDYKGSEEVVNKTPLYTQVNTLSNYAVTKTITVKAVDKANKPIAGADVEFKLYNYAEFYTLSKFKTDSKGECKFTTGLGDLLVWAKKDSLFGYKKISVEKVKSITVKIDKQPGKEYVEIYDFAPPIEKIPYKVDETGKERNAHKLRTEDSIRGAYEATFMDSVSAAALAKSVDLPVDTVWYFIKKSKGNWKEIAGFIKNGSAKRKNETIALLARISEKDLRDTREKILMDHLDFSQGALATFITDDKQTFYADYILAPRIDNEMLVDYRDFLQKQFPPIFVLKAQKKIAVVVDWIKENIKIDSSANYYNVPLTPRGVFELKVSDKHSRDILFVAMCRSFGIPARLEPATGVPQFYFRDWVDIYFDKPITPEPEKGYIVLENVSGNKTINPEYYIHFTLAKYNDGTYNSLDYEYDGGKGILNNKTAFDKGSYMLVTGSRLTDGTVLTKLSFFNLKKDETKTVKLDIRSSQAEAVIYGKLALKSVFEKENTKEKIDINSLPLDKAAVLVWIDPDKEPTKHVLLDIQTLKEKFEKWGCGLLFIKPGDLKKANLNKEIQSNLPSQSIFCVDENRTVLNAVRKATGRNTKSLPVIAVINSSGEIVYYSEGYKIGVGEQAAKAIVQAQSSCRR